MKFYEINSEKRDHVIYRFLNKFYFLDKKLKSL